jgi:trigger factor
VGAGAMSVGTLERPCPLARPARNEEGTHTSVKLTVEQLPESQVLLDIVADEQEVKEATDKAFRSVARNIRIPGFRPGKAPKHIIDRMYGSGVYEEEAHRIVIDRLYRDAVKQEEIIVVGQPSVEITEVEPLSFKITVPVFPTIDPGDYTSVRVESRDAAITEDEVETTIQELRKNRGEWIAVDDATVKPVEGDRVTINIETTLDEEEFEKPAENAEFILGTSPLFPELVTVIQGMTIGETTDTAISFAEDAEDVDDRLKGNTLHYKITLNKIDNRQVPELDDAFAKAAAQVDTVEALREEVRKDLHREKTQQTRNEAINEIYDKIAEGATLEIPSVMIDEAVQEEIKQVEQRFAQQGMPLDMYLQFQGQTRESYGEELRPGVEKRMRRSLVLGVVAEREGIVVDDAAIEEEIANQTSSVPNAEALRDLYSKEGYFRQLLRDDIYNRKLSSRLIEIATDGGEIVTNGWVEPVVIDIAEGETTPAEADADASQAMGFTAASTELPSGAVAGTGESDCIEGFPIKGNASSMIYHLPGTSSYERTIPEMCFATEEDAVAAGYRASKSSIKASESED